MKIAVFSHSYQERENRKNIHALGDYASVRAVIPSRGEFFGEPVDLREDADGDEIMPVATIRLFRTQYVFRSLDLGFRNFKPDVIQVEYNPWSTVFLQTWLCKLLFCRNAKIVPVIKKNTFRGGAGLLDLLRKRIANHLINKADHIFAASRMVADMLEDRFGIPAGRITVAHHLGVDTDVFSPKDNPGRDDSLVVGFCGWFEARKGVLELVEAVRLARQKSGRSIGLRLLGYGTLREELERRQASLPWLEIYPAVPNREVACFLQDIDIFLQPSRILNDHQEHDAHALMEAMSVGVPSVGCRSGIIPEILECCPELILDSGDLDGLADKISMLVEDEDMRNRLGQLSREVAVSQFSISVVARQKIEVLRDLIDE